MPIDGWRIHRRIGMSGGLFARAVAREVGRELSAAETEAIQLRHGAIFRELLPERRPLPGARELSPTYGSQGSCTASPPRTAGPKSTSPSRRWGWAMRDRKSTRLNSSHLGISY